MSSKIIIATDEGFTFYHDSLFDDELLNVFISVENPIHCKIERTSSGDIISNMSLTSEDMDKIAISWIKERKLQSLFGGPVGNEFGSPDCEYY